MAHAEIADAAMPSRTEPSNTRNGSLLWEERQQATGRRIIIARVMKLFAAVIPVVALGAIIGVYLGGVDVAKLPAATHAVTFTDRSGIALGTVLASDSSHAVSVPLTRISPVFLKAIVAAEDARFYDHGAIDVPALFRAARDYAVFGEPRSGGSTIAMQLARLLHPATSPSSIREKVLQIGRAERIAVRSSRSAILEAYVNRVPMGGNLYGVEAAARTYFGEPASDLDLAQSALLAAIPNDPSGIAPDVNWHALRLRQRYVLNRMADLAEISRAQAARAWNETLHVRPHDTGVDDAAHALFYLYPRVARSDAGRVRTTLDRGLQRFAQAQTEDVVGALDAYHVTDGAALVVDNHTGDVLAYVGSPDYFSDEVLGRNDGVQALRQPGSSLKPFTYELALERAVIRSTTILPDVPAAYAIANGQLYQPGDYSGRFSGPVRVRYALANSLNAPAVHVLSALGVGTLLDRLHELGFDHLDRPASYYGLGLTLGSGEVSLWELVQAYTTLARDGTFVPIHLLADPPISAQRHVGDARYWALITNMLADAQARAKSFGVHSVLEMPFDAAVKTGTSSDFRDTWTVGYTRDYTVGVWVGNFDGSAMRGVSGVTGAGPLWNRIMLHLYDRNDDPEPFGPPPGFVRTPICATTGHTPLRDCSAVVEEWVRPSDLTDVRRAVPQRLGRSYDAWLALHPEDARSTSLRIVYPHDGDVFVLNTTANALQSREQQLAFRAVGADRSIHWTINGDALRLDADGAAFWPLHVGQWTIQAQDATRRDRITIRVVPPEPVRRPGFTYLLRD
jgi:penicillin-binding protein 1C